MFATRQMLDWKRIVLGALLAFALIPAGWAADLNQSFTKEVRPLFEKYCFNCHKPEKSKGGVDLTKYKDLATTLRDARAWETILKQLRDRDMPPEDKKQPTQDEREKMVTWGRDALASLDFASVKDPGRKVIHRLNRTEYNNTVRDLLGVTIRPADNFPADGGGGGGFDNNADTLFIPPILMEKYLDAADQVLKAAPADRLIVAKPIARVSKNTVAKKILEYHLPRAFRRPVGQEEFALYFTLFEKSLNKGDSFEDAIKLPLKAMLVSPNFLFRTEEEKPMDGAHNVNDFELATRLSYFLWSSMPDDALFEQAYANKLHDPVVLETEVKRMLADKKSRAFAENFAGQWLGVNKLKTSVEPDTRKFPEYTKKLRDSLYEEPIVFFQDLVRRDASLINLLDANYAMLNEDLAKHYGITGVTGPELRQVTLKDKSRGGVFGMGAVLTLTSYPRRTSPVLRGKWVLEEILGTPAPPPPPNAAGLSSDDHTKDGLSFRQRLEAHRSKPECAACHAKMDPIGFGLENFDAIGRWRDTIDKEKVDSSGEFAGGTKFKGPIELKTILLKQKDLFYRNVTEKMLAYALGRGLEYYDSPTVRHIETELGKADYHATKLVLEIVKSYPFQHRRGSKWQEQVASK